ncbi:MAG: hypothetical protein U0V73_04800 [Acidimicrobiia bacterium]
MNKLGLVAATLAVLVGSGALTSCLDLPGLLDDLTAWVTLAIAQVMMTVLFAGVVLRALRPGPVLALALAVTAGCVVAAVVHRRRRPGAWAWRERWWPGVRAFGRTLRSPWVAVLAAAAFVEVCWSAAVAWLMPPYGWDALWYHLPAIADWMRTERIAHVSYMHFSDAFPGNAWLVYAWPGLFLGNDVLVDSGQMVFALAGALAVAGLVRTIGCSRRSAVAAGCLYLLTPIVLQQLTVDYVDVAVASMFVVALHFLTRFLVVGCRIDLRVSGDTPPPDPTAPVARPATERRLAWSYLALAGIAGGVMLGIKATGPIYASVLGVTLVAGLVVARRRRCVGRGAAAGFVSAFVGLTLILGGFWMLRNWVTYGNPAYPITVRAAGVEVFAGHGPSDLVNNHYTIPAELAGRPLWAQLWRTWTHEPTEYTYDTRRGGLGPQWTYVGLPAAVALAIVSIRRRRALTVFVLGPFVLAFVLQPARWWSRFTITLAALGALATVWLVSQLRPRALRVASRCVVLLAVGVSLVYSYPRRTITTTDVTLGRLRDVARMRPADRTIGNLVRRDFAFVDRLPRGSTFALGGRLDRYGAFVGDADFFYPFFGSDWSDALTLVTSKDAAELVRDLRRARVDYLATVEGSRFDRWAAADPARFRPVFGLGARHVYELTAE